MLVLVLGTKKLKIKEQKNANLSHTGHSIKKSHKTRIWSDIDQ